MTSDESSFLHILIDPLDSARPQILKHAKRSKVCDNLFELSLLLQAYRSHVIFAMEGRKLTLLSALDRGRAASSLEQSKLTETVSIS